MVTPYANTGNILNTPSWYEGDDFLAASILEPTTGCRVDMVGTAHMPKATLETPEIQATLEVVGGFMASTRRDNRPRVAYNEGATPQIKYNGDFYDNPFTRDRIVDAGDLEGAVRSDGERGVLLCQAVAEGCRIVGEDDIAIMRSGQFASDALLKYLVARQITNYFLKPAENRNALEDYLDETVLGHYNYGARIDAERYNWQVADALAYVDDSLAVAKLQIDDEKAVMQHFKEQSLIQILLRSCSLVL